VLCSVVGKLIRSTLDLVVDSLLPARKIPSEASNLAGIVLAVTDVRRLVQAFPSTGVTQFDGVVAALGDSLLGSIIVIDPFEGDIRCDHVAYDAFGIA
jgi:hypothetical protein